MEQTQACLFIVLMFAQICDLMISPIMKLPYRGTLYYSVSLIFDSIRIYPAVITILEDRIYWLFMFGFLVVIAVYLLMMILADHLIRNNSTHVDAPCKFLRTASSIFFWLLVIPVTDFFISIFECTDDGNHFKNPTLKCWSGIHIFFCVLFTFGLVIFVTFLSLISLLYNESRPYHTDALTRLDNN